MKPLLKSRLFWRIGIPLLVLGGIPAMLFPVFGRARENARRSSCQSNLKQMMLGIRQYLQDNNEVFPPISLAPKPGEFTKEPWYGWGDGLQPYLKSVCIYQCPSETTAPGNNANQGGYLDYFYNAKLARQNLNRFDAARVVSLGDGTTGAHNARYALSDWPDSSGDRHLGGQNFAFADGHVKWLSRSEMDELQNAGLKLQIR